jgi:hypothetical protein
MSKIVHHTPKPATMSSIELADVINGARKIEADGAPFSELRHDNLMVKIVKVLGDAAPKFSGTVTRQQPAGGSREYPCYHLPKREAELVAMSESYAVQARVYDRMIELEIAALPAPRPRVTADPALSAFRQARAIEIAAKIAGSICDRFPGLGQAAQQVIYAKLVNPAAGADVMPLPVLECTTKSATEVGAELGITSQRVGIIANANGLKVPEFGIFVLDKSRSSDKQVQTFRYNDAGVKRISDLAGKGAQP